jgi:outer membrane protein assembly factor BamB
LAFALVFGVVGVAASDVEDWPMFRHDSQHTGHSISMRPYANSLLWRYATPGAVESSPTVVGDRVYVGSDDGNVYCLNVSTGIRIWNRTIGPQSAQYVSSPAVDGGIVYVGSYTGMVYGLNASDGVQVWNFTTGDRVYSSPAAVDGRVFIGAYDGNGVYCLNGSTGVKLWNHATGGQVWSSPAVFEDRVYVGSIQDHGVYCLNASDGTGIWNYTTGGAVWSSPAVADGKVYVGSNDNRTYCFDALNGTLIWNYAAGNIIESSPAVADDRVYVGSYDDNVYCLNGSTGDLIWNYTAGGAVVSSPAFAAGNVHVGCYDNKIYCLDASTGAHIWNYTTGNYIISSPAVVNGRLYVGSTDHGIYCLGSNVTANAPLFELMSEEKHEFEGGANLTYTFRDLSFSAAAGSVWVPEERVTCDVPLVNGSSGVPTGNLSESALSLDINGDGDKSDVFNVNYVDNSTAEVNGVTAHAQLPPHRRVVFPTVEGYGIYYLYDDTSFQLGSKNLTLHRVTYPTGDNIGHAEFGLDSTFRYHSSPCLELILEQLGESINSLPSAELVSVSFNGSVLPVESLLPQASPHGEGQWLVDKTYSCSLGALEKNDVFTVELSVRGEPGTYLLMADLNWSPDSVSRYVYPNVDVFALSGTVHESIPFGNTTYSIDVLTNCTVPQGIAYKWRTKELDFSANGLGTFTYFWNVTVPQGLLRGSPWSVDIAGSPVNVFETSNNTHAFLHFTLNATALPADFFSDSVSVKGLGVWMTRFPREFLFPSEIRRATLRS